MKTRIVFLDYARIITAFLVVFTHMFSITSSERLYVFAFHMPLFFIVSGMLHKGKTLLLSTKKLFNSIIIPIMIFMVYGVLFDILLHHDVSVIKTNLIDAYNSIEPRSNAVVWFLFTLMWVKIYMLIINNVKPIYIVILWVISLIITKRFNHFYMGNGVMALPFYYLGFILKDILLRIKERSIIQLCAIFILFCIGTFMLTRYNGKVSMAAIHFGKIPFLNVFIFYLNGFVGTVMIFVLSSFLKKSYNIINLTSNALISILGFQFPMYMFFLDKLGYNGRYMEKVFISIFVMVVCTCLHYIITKPIMKYVRI